MKVFSKKR